MESARTVLAVARSHEGRIDASAVGELLERGDLAVAQCKHHGEIGLDDHPMMPPAGKPVGSALPEFSLVEGGPLHGLMRWVRIGGRPIGPVRFGVALALLTWLPLPCLVLLERLGPGPGQAGSFLASIDNNVRFLVAIPLMFCDQSPDRPVGLAPPHVGGVPLATLPCAPPAHAHAPGSGGGLGYLPVAQSHFEILCTVFSAVVAGVWAERMMFLGMRLEELIVPLVTLVVAKPGALPRAAVLLRPAAPGGQAPRSARVWRPRHRLRPWVRRQVAPRQDPGGRAPPRQRRHPIAQ